jgi:hypothetical protein
METGKWIMAYLAFPKNLWILNMNGKIPENYNQLKIRINNSNERIIIPLVRY